jgi:hypothetical protein
VLDLQPDLVIANAEENRQEDIRQLLAAGQRVFVTFPRTVAAAIQMLRQLAQMTGSNEVADPILEDAEQTLAAAKAANQGRTRLRLLSDLAPPVDDGWAEHSPDFIPPAADSTSSPSATSATLSDLDEVARRVPG